ncbi:hypothetical protein [Thiomonas sp. CB2]|uniref:hypothetical protein n=1 Tax=Thiomonas sp. CB2 TaxID=554131 RepID=UPI0012DE0040|nr:hypothetical protein [Thiomonas sp. CB2]
MTAPSWRAADMSLQAIAQRIKARSATPETPEKNMGLQPEPAPLLACTLATPETPVFVNTRSEPANDARDLDEAQSERAAIQHFDGGIDAALADLLARHGGYHGIDWQGLALIDAEKSALWIVQRPDGLLTTLATVDPIPKPRSYRNAWPARFTGPEPADDAAPAAAQAAQTAIGKARQSCWDCRHLRTTGKPVCALRHTVGWQTAQTRTYPRRFDATDCGDHRHE